ncbi:MAG: hypothetical protein P9L94_15750 [Candidatus Hinthialibacter antarcticus]|nr:hypothetical protein [Candidatus Hinthialibacter antarcticus]
MNQNEIAKTCMLSRRGEFRVVLLYVPAVLIYGLLANVGTPVLEVIWDMVFYKSMAFSLHNWSSFDLSKNQSVPPLYPAILSVAFFAKDYLTVEFIQSWINPALYFIGLFPLYRLARMFADPVAALTACVFYLFYPAVVYTQWSMSENLAAPLTLFLFWAAAVLLQADRSRWLVAVGFAVVLAALCLTRIQALLLCGFIGVWVPFRCWRTKKPIAPPLVGALLSGLIVIGVWWGLGFLGVERNSPFYFDLEKPDALGAAAVASKFLTLLAAHGAALWVEGALLLTPILLGAWLVSILVPKCLTPLEREYALMIGWALWLIVGFVALYYILRAPYENWSIGLRYIFYLNHAALPLAVAFLGRFRLSKDDASVPGGASIIFSAVFLFAVLIASGVLWTDVWPALGAHKTFFTNAPSLDFLTQLRNEGPWVGGGILLLISALIVTLWFSTKRFGLVLAAVVMLYIQFATLEGAIGIRKAAAQTLWGESIHYFCDDIQHNKWGDVPLYCQEEFPFLIPNLYYWVQRPVGAAPADGSGINPPYVLLTPGEWSEGELVFAHGGLKAYFVGSSPSVLP